MTSFLRGSCPHLRHPGPVNFPRARSRGRRVPLRVALAPPRPASAFPFAAPTSRTSQRAARASGSTSTLLGALPARPLSPGLSAPMPSILLPLTTLSTRRGAYSRSPCRASRVPAGHRAPLQVARPVEAKALRRPLSPLRPQALSGTWAASDHRAATRTQGVPRANPLARIRRALRRAPRPPRRAHDPRHPRGHRRGRQRTRRANGAAQGERPLTG
jgi:hypothetical protein